MNGDSSVQFKPQLNTSGENKLVRQRKLSFPSPRGHRTPMARRRFSNIVPPTKIPARTQLLSPPPALDVPNSSVSRLSDVGVAVGRKLSATFGWKYSFESTQRNAHTVACRCCGQSTEVSAALKKVVEETQCLVSQMIRCRVKRQCRVPVDRRIYLQRLGSLPRLSAAATDIGSVFKQLQLVAVELERLRPALYSCISRQLNTALVHEHVLSQLTTAIATSLFAQPQIITWAKIASLCVIVSCLAVECVDIGHPEYIRALVDATGSVAYGNMGVWIVKQGGWSSILHHYATPGHSPTVKFLTASLVLLISIGFIVSLYCKYLRIIYEEELIAVD